MSGSGRRLSVPAGSAEVLCTLGIIKLVSSPPARGAVPLQGDYDDDVREAVPAAFGRCLQPGGQLQSITDLRLIGSELPGNRPNRRAAIRRLTGGDHADAFVQQMCAVLRRGGSPLRKISIRGYAGLSDAGASLLVIPPPVVSKISGASRDSSRCTLTERSIFIFFLLLLRMYHDTTHFALASAAHQQLPLLSRMSFACLRARSSSFACRRAKS